MALTMKQAAEALKVARANQAGTKAARKDAEDRLKEAIKDDQAAMTAVDNARAVVDAAVNHETAPE